jgi:hypothetical protein
VPELTAVLRGVALRAGSKEPVSGVRIEILMRGRVLARATTDAAGRFEVRGPPGEVTVRFTYLDGDEPVTRERTATARAGSGTDLELPID